MSQEAPYMTSNQTDDEESAESSLMPAKKEARLPFTEPCLPDLDTFAGEYTLYPHCIVAVYHIIRDQHIKREMTELTVVDAKPWGKSEYFLEGKVRDAPYKTRLLIPYHLDAQVDLHWLFDVTKAYIDNTKEVYMVIHTAETIIYQSVHAQLPGLE
jgi:hypothetical protein